ncbi:MAG TPA: molybdenum cofactor guanylyltransferase, partial [Acidobacteriota bacterium]|nr:molybdenum cofactor guanylyltransferase [Acidobacteriota bacterium]
SSMKKKLSGAILAGGQGRRLGGVAKGMILVNGRPIIARVAETLAGFVEETIIVSNDANIYRFLELPVFPDDEAGRGPLQGIVTAIRKSAWDQVIVAPCDMPYVTPEAIRTLLSYAHDADAVVPLSAKGWEPLFAVYSKACLAAAEKVLESGRRRIIEFLPDVRTVYIPAGEFDESLWFNINNHVDLRQAKGTITGCDSTTK